MNLKLDELVQKAELRRREEEALDKMHFELEYECDHELFIERL